MTPTAPPTADTHPPKSTLFCQDCGHQSPVDGDWMLVATARGTAYRCPQCGADLTIRPALATTSARSQPFEAWQHLRHAWCDSVRAWRAMYLG